MFRSYLHCSASFSLLIDTSAVHTEKNWCPTAWSVWTTGPTATWPGRWSASWTAWAMVPGWTRATVALLRPCPELSAPSTTLSLSSRAPWTACTNWTPPAHSTIHQRNHHPLSKYWWRNKEAAALLSKVGTLCWVYHCIYALNINCTTSFMSMDRLWKKNVSHWRPSLVLVQYGSPKSSHMSQYFLNLKCLCTILLAK